MKNINILFTIAIVAVLLSLNSCKEKVYSENSGLLISSAGNSQKGINSFANVNEYSMMKLVLNYGTVTPYKKILSNWYVTESNNSILNNEGC
ncbi:MAG: hypothetical protein HY951_00180 [Bacteroidia bacterium]|nr:hypothetical protein [Bacteroidia bacterium]